VAGRFAKEAEIIGLDRIAGPWTSEVGDITDPKLVLSLSRRVDAVVHVAGLHAPHVRCRSEEEFRRVNVEGTKILLDAALRAGIRRFVFTSTTSVYGCTSRPKEGAIWVTEGLEPHPEDIYDFTKLEAERLCREASHADMSVAVLRMSRCFPEPARFVVFYRLYRGVDRRDVAEGHWLAATVPLKGFEIFNLSAEPIFKPEDTDLLWTDPWRVIDRHAPGVRGIFLRERWKMPQRIDRVYAIEKAKTVLGYRPRYGIKAALDEMTALQF
jgi:nucleoside-diphosphate-sugar epimerase